MKYVMRVFTKYFSRQNLLDMWGFAWQIENFPCKVYIYLIIDSLFQMAVKSQAWILKSFSWDLPILRCHRCAS
jgi:hypothetical protein